jgi:hypothetical protein
MDTSPHTPQEVRRWAHQRRPHEREAPPVPGERLLVREADFADPVPAVVVAVQDMTVPGDHWNGRGVPDPNVWRFDEARQAWDLADDPWPWVQVRAVRAGGDGQDLAGEDGEPVLAQPRWHKEARVRGSAGWLRGGSRAHTGSYETED